MLSSELRSQITDIATEINKISESYQLIHATSAIEKLIEQKREQSFIEEMARIREALLTADKDTQEELKRQVAELKSEARHQYRIQIQYIPQIREDSARLTRTPSNTLIILLPQSLQNPRNDDGSINFERMRRLRKLMAHELGHIVLHTGVLHNLAPSSAAEKEMQADLFATTLIDLRKARNAEIYSGRHFEEF